VTKLRVAVVGAGHLGKIHARLLQTQTDAQLVAVADPSSAAREQISQELGVPTVNDYRELFGKIDAAIVATPTRMHFEIAQELLSQKIHTLIEKPMTDSVSDAQELVHLANRHQCVVSVGHVERYNPAIKSALELVGIPKFIQASRMSGFTFRSTDIGVVHDLMIHDIDLVNSIFPGKLIETRALGMSVFGSNEDMAQARLQFDCGGVANLSASRCSYQAERSFQVFGTDGFANANLTQSTVTFVKVPGWIKDREYDLLDTTPEQQAVIREELFSRILPKSEIEVPKTNAILSEQKNWITAIRDGEPCQVTAQQGKEAVEIAQSVIDSLAAHRWSKHDPQSTGPFGMIDSTRKKILPFRSKDGSKQNKAA